MPIHFEANALQKARHALRAWLKTRYSRSKHAANLFVPPCSHRRLSSGPGVHTIGVSMSVPPLTHSPTPARGEKRDANDNDGAPTSEYEPASKKVKEEEVEGVETTVDAPVEPVQSALVVSAVADMSNQDDESDSDGDSDGSDESSVASAADGNNGVIKIGASHQVRARRRTRVLQASADWPSEELGGTTGSELTVFERGVA